jgi:beta-glucosidase-like glycosyl hydrolase
MSETNTILGGLEMKKKRFVCSQAVALAIVMAASSMTVLPVQNYVYAAETEEKITFPDVYTADLVQPESDEDVVNAKVEALLKTMTLEEKYSFLGGSGMGTEGEAGNLPGVGRLGVPAIKMHDGPAGIYYMTDTTNPPQEVLLAATWDEEMAEKYGELVSEESKAVGAGMMLSAQVDIQRNPQFGRTKDQMGEDPYLLASLADDLVEGMQSAGGIAVLKHFAGYTEGNNNEVISEQALHEVYLAGFESAIKNADALGVMSSYNLVNGEYASANTYLQNDVLRDMWGYQYFTITDWGGNHEFTLNKGTDIEMPTLSGNGLDRLQNRISDEEEETVNGGFGYVAEETLETFTQEEADELVDTAVARILRAYGKAGYLTLVQVDEDGYAKEEEGRTEPIEQISTDVAVEQLAELYDSSNETVEEIAEAGIVLLKNEDGDSDDEKMLPLTEEDSVAVIGLTGLHLASGIGGEHSYGSISAMTSPYEALTDILGEDAVTGEVYSDIIGTTIPNENLYTSADGDEHGVTRTYGVSQAQSATLQMEGNGGGMFGSSITDTAMEGHEIGEFCQIDDEVNFTTGTVNGEANKTYLVANADEGTATAFDVAESPAYTWEGYIEAPEDGEYTISFQSIGATANMAIYEEDDTTVLTQINGSGATRQGCQWYDSIVPTETGMNIVTSEVTLEAGKRYRFVVQGSYSVEDKDMQINLSWITPSQKEANLNNAIEAAQTNDKVLVFAYALAANSASESSREDVSLKLSDDQEEMINTIAAAAHEAGNEVCVVLNHSNQVVMEDWIDNVDGIMDMFYAGQRGGVAVAKLLTGEVNPSGKLPYTIPKTDEDTLITYSDEAWAMYQAEADSSSNVKTTIYSEGINTGYKWFDEMGIEPQYDFGYGLSYTTFEYSDMTVTEATEDGESIGYDVTFNITNTGDVAGDEVAQIYLGEAEVPEGIQSSKYTLAGYQKVKDIQPGETREVTIHVSERSLSYWNSNQTELTEREDGTKDKWTVATGTRTIYVGAASDDLILQEDITI